ncbi:MAG: hypothetical protein AAF436_11605 [Myxococcota bacterium]
MVCLVLAGLSGTACSGDGSPNGVGGDSLESIYLVSSNLTTPGGNTGFVSLLTSLDPALEELDLANAYEFPGSADAWVLDGRVFTSGGDAPTVTRHRVSEAGELVEETTLSFGNFGVASTAFWHNVFVSPTKAYMEFGGRQLVIWNPTTMELGGTLDIPEVEDRQGLRPTFAFGDRGSVIAEGLLYQLVYWTDPSFARRDDGSRILVYDVERDELVDSIEAPCPGLDVASRDPDTGLLYFSPWTSGAGAALVLEDKATCVVELDPNLGEITRTFDFRQIAEGREGAVFRALGNGRFVFSAFHADRVDLEAAIDEQDPFTILAGENWRLWSYDMTTGIAVAIDGVAWNSGAAYWFVVDGEHVALIPGADFSSSTAYRLASDDTAEELFDYSGFALRLFRVR